MCIRDRSIYAAESTNPAIAIEKPDGWKQGDTSVSITVDASQMGEGFKVAKIEAKTGKDGSWQDVTESRSITINGNQTIYVRVTDAEGTVYEQNRSIRCYDTEKPTLSASLTDGVLTIQAVSYTHLVPCHCPCDEYGKEKAETGQQHFPGAGHRTEV